MYKYKKTIVINNRRRRIFSKEKSNAEYILYKNDYITLNAYNKRTGGSNTDYEEEEEDEELQMLIDVSKSLHNNKFNKICSKLHDESNCSIRSDKYINYIDNYTNVPSTIRNKYGNYAYNRMLYFDETNLNNIKIFLYYSLVNDNYYIYYLLTDLDSKNLNPIHEEIRIRNRKLPEYTIDRYYKLFDGTIFKCTNINEINGKFDISFKFCTNNEIYGGQMKYKNLKLKNT